MGTGWEQAQVMLVDASIQKLVLQEAFARDNCAETIDRRENN
jgi:hypothetical protein